MGVDADGSIEEDAEVVETGGEGGKGSEVSGMSRLRMDVEKRWSRGVVDIVVW